MGDGFAGARISTIGGGRFSSIKDGTHDTCFSTTAGHGRRRG